MTQHWKNINVSTCHTLPFQAYSESISLILLLFVATQISELQSPKFIRLGTGNNRCTITYPATWDALLCQIPDAITHAVRILSTRTTHQDACGPWEASFWTSILNTGIKCANFSTVLSCFPPEVQECFHEYHRESWLQCWSFWFLFGRFQVRIPSGRIYWFWFIAAFLCLYMERDG